jgi:hypothetical protein
MSVDEKNGHTLVVPLRGLSRSGTAGAPTVTPRAPVFPPRTIPNGRDRSWIHNLLRPQEPTLFHRCLAVHLHFAGPSSALTD